MTKHRLIIVDDEANIREGLSGFEWETLGIELAGAYENGLEALRSFEEEPADLLLADIRMPLMDGLELAEKVKTRSPLTKIVILTGYSDFDLVRTSLRYGVSDYLLKPSAREDLIKAFKPLVAQLNDERREADNERLLQRRLQQASALWRIQFLSKLLCMPLSQEEIEEACGQAYLVQDATAYTVAVVGLDARRRQDYSIKDWELILFALENALSELRQSEGLGSYLVESETGCCYIVGMCGARELARRSSSVRGHLYRFGGLFKTTMSIGLGEPVSRLADVSLSREQADIAFRRANGEEDIVFYEPEDGGAASGSEAAKEAAEEEKENEADAPGDSETGRRIVESARKYVREHFREPISLKQIARYLHVNSAYLSFLFKEVTGENYLQYLTSCRMAEAELLLRDPAFKIYEIAERVGYHNAQHFSIVFKKYRQLTPLEYRNKHVLANFAQEEASRA
ncbi:response regulator transcription factor [Cohnella rhizosphaerae]|uniref:Response regulator n=1 Tax=Cohnella rhizosphaerae TaxID=1457232 RepID=A0A9X4KNG6_9BACL|nr:response regulator [Cohnella rhizosphaerae]MDG0808159.1 response regulator [Cohnella rhizosphaerae]